MFVIVDKDTMFQSFTKKKASEIKPGDILICMKYNQKKKYYSAANFDRVKDVKTVKCDLLQIGEYKIFVKSKSIDSKGEVVDVNDEVYGLMYGAPVKVSLKKGDVIKDVEAIQIEMSDINAIPYIFDDMLIVFSDEPIKENKKHKHKTRKKNTKKEKSTKETEENNTSDTIKDDKKIYNESKQLEDKKENQVTKTKEETENNKE